MRTKYIIAILLISILSIISACSGVKEPSQSSVSLVLCPSSFKQTYIKNFSDKDIFFIKGITSEIYQYGREIQVIEDLKGNFIDKSTIFVWGAGYPSEGISIENDRLDNIIQYQKNDTLIMFIRKVHKRFDKDIEKSGDYAILEGARSILKLSGNYVSGHINSWYEDEKQETMLWKKLQEEMQTFLNSDEKPAWWSNKKCIPDAFYEVYRKEHSNEDVFFIQGTVLETYQQYGKKIEITTDLKGNFPKEKTNFIAWGDLYPTSSYSDRFDNLRLYNDQDTLLMLLLPVPDLENYFPNSVEKWGDYKTFPLAFSVLKLSSDTVIGYITSCYEKEMNMAWNEFQTLLDSIKKAKP